ncbi:hypothetical protein GEMRC1_009042 [Eukaryota sp. GEM-RC1]
MSTRGYACKDCDKVFGSKQGLRKHVNAKHSTKFQCSECLRTCESAAKLRQHMLIHTGEKPHECEGCHQRFTEKGALKDHRRRCKVLNSKPDHEYRSSGVRILNYYSDSEGVEYGVSCPVCEEEASAKVKDIVFCEGFCKWAFHVECVENRWDTGTAFVCEECVMLKAHDEKKKIMKNKTLEVSDLSLMWIRRTMNEDGSTSMSCKSLLTGRPFSIYKAPSTLTNAGNGLFVSKTLIPHDLIAYWRGVQISKKLAKRSFTSYIVQRKDGMYLDGSSENYQSTTF